MRGCASCSRRRTTPRCATVAPLPGRARHAHDLQPARPAVEPGRGEAPAASACFSPRLDDALAETLRALGSDRVWVVHGSDGLDEADHDRAQRGRGAGGRRDPHVPDRSARRRPGARRAVPAQGRRSRATTRRRCAPCSRGEKDALSRHRGAQRRPDRSSSPGAFCRGSRERASPRRRRRSTRARPSRLSRAYGARLEGVRARR